MHKNYVLKSDMKTTSQILNVDSWFYQHCMLEIFCLFFSCRNLRNFINGKVQGQITEIFMGWFPSLYLENHLFFNNTSNSNRLGESHTCQLPRYIQTVASCLRPGLFGERPVLFIYSCNDLFRPLLPQLAGFTHAPFLLHQPHPNIHTNNTWVCSLY